MLLQERQQPRVLHPRLRGAEGLAECGSGVLPCRFLLFTLAALPSLCYLAGFGLLLALRGLGAGLVWRLGLEVAADAISLDFQRAIGPKRPGRGYSPVMMTIGYPERVVRRAWRGLASDRRAVTVEIDFAPDIEIEAFRETFDFDFGFKRAETCRTARI